MQVSWVIHGCDCHGLATSSALGGPVRKEIIQRAFICLGVIPLLDDNP